MARRPGTFLSEFSLRLPSLRPLSVPAPSQRPQQPPRRAHPMRPKSQAAGVIRPTDSFARTREQPPQRRHQQPTRPRTPRRCVPARLTPVDPAGSTTGTTARRACVLRCGPGGRLFGERTIPCADSRPSRLGPGDAPHRSRAAPAARRQDPSNHAFRPPGSPAFSAAAAERALARVRTGRPRPGRGERDPHGRERHLPPGFGSP
jgi:hypothetical protein